jgi:cobalt/nickel transport system permease protein
MTLPVAFPVRLDAPLSRLDPRWRLAALLPAGAVAGMLQTPGPALVALGGAALIVGLARIPPRWYATRVATVAFFLGLFLLFLPLVPHEPEKRWWLGPVSLSPRGLTVALVLLVKAVALVSLLLAASTTAPLDVQLKALYALHVPGLVVQLVALTVRYLGVLLEEFATLRIALRVRGYRQRVTPRSLRTIGHVAGMLLVRASERAERVGQALRCRGFDGRFHALTEFRSRWIDGCFFAAVTATAAALLLWDLVER